MNAAFIRQLAVTVRAWGFHGASNVGTLCHIERAKLETSGRTRQARTELLSALLDREIAIKHAATRAADHDVAHVACRDSYLAIAKVAYEACEYRRSKSAWAGGDHYTEIRFRANESWMALGCSHRARSKNSKWTGTNSSHTVLIDPASYALVARLGLTTITRGASSGCRMVVAAHITGRILTITYVIPSRGFDLSTATLEILLHDGDCATHPEMARECGCAKNGCAA